MRSAIVFLFSIFAFNAIKSQSSEKINIPKGIVYNYADSKIVESAKKIISENLKTNDYSLLQPNLMVGPGLWKRFKHIQELNEIKEGKVILYVDGLELDGKMSQTINDSKKIWNEIKKEVNNEFVIRKADERELTYYWSVISFDIDEPLLIVETKQHKYILNLLKDNLKLLWLDEVPATKDYFNPIENTTYKSENGFKSYQNGNEITENSKGNKETKLEKVVLLTSDKELKERITVEDISSVISKTDLIFEELFKNSDKPGKIMLQFELGKKKNKIQFAVKDDIDLNIMKKFEKQVNKEKYPNTKSDTVKLQLIYKVNSFNDIE